MIQFCQNMELITCTKGVTVYSEYAKASHIFFVESGSIDISKQVALPHTKVEEDNV